MVNQQQLAPEPQDENATDMQEHEEIYQRPYKSTRARSAMPKEEHPSTFEETIPPHSYRAQDQSNHDTMMGGAHFHETNARERQSRRRRFSPDGDALEDGYRPYQQQQRMAYQIPSWARPQPQKRSHFLRWLILIVLAIVLIKPIVILIGGLFFAGLTVLAFILLIPLLILGVLLLAGVILAILGIILGRAVWRSIWHW